MDSKIPSLLLVAAAFGIGIFVADRSDAATDTLTGRLATVSLIGLTGVSVYLWYRHVLKQSRQKWEDILDMVHGEFSEKRVALRGVDNGTPVFVRIDSGPAPELSSEPVATTSETSKCLYALTMAFPVWGETDWSIVPGVEGQTDQHVAAWQVVTPDLELKKKFEEGGIPDLLADCDTTARLVCKAKAGEVTLEYPAPDTNYCPDPDAFQKELELLRKAVELWHQKTRSIVAA